MHTNIVKTPTFSKLKPKQVQAVLHRLGFDWTGRRVQGDGWTIIKNVRLNIETGDYVIADRHKIMAGEPLEHGDLLSLVKRIKGGQ